MVLRKQQELPTIAAEQMISFTINGRTYVAVTNGKNDTAIYLSDGSTLRFHQSLASTGPRRATFFTVQDGTTQRRFLAVAHFQNPTTLASAPSSSVSFLTFFRSFFLFFGGGGTKPTNRKGGGGE